MEWLIGFCAGFVADLFRSVFLPTSTDWINRFIPAARHRANVKKNMLTLEIMNKLQSLGKNPDLAMHARDDAAKFMSILTSQQEAFVENAIEVIDSTHMTQTDMNIEAGRRAAVAHDQMERALISLEQSGWLEDQQISALRETQTQWEAYAKARAKFAAAEFEGGSMASLIYSSELEFATVSRTGELKRTLDGMRERCS